MSIDGSERRGRGNLSALADGELDPSGSAGALSMPGARADARADWHAWHLIGDVLRSEDLAADPRRDAAFLRRAPRPPAGEPVVLAPRPRADRAAGPPRRPLSRRRGAGRAGARSRPASCSWSARSVPRRPGDAPVVVPVARTEPRGAASAGTAVAAATRPALPAERASPTARSIRDARLDRYLAAHKQFAGTSALGVPSAFLRSATVDSASR